MCRAGRSHAVSSSVPARTRIMPARGGLANHELHSGQVHRVLTRPLSAMRRSGRGSMRRNALSATTSPSEKALLVSRWQSLQWRV
jgi:hypothetical protein